MSQNNLVSITIVTYNSGRFIKRCLESVLAQRYPYREIIVIDNNSTDGTVDILEQFEDRCTVVYNERKHRIRGGAESGDRALERRLGADAEPGRAAASQFHPGSGGCRPDRSEDRRGLRQAAGHDRDLRYPGAAAWWIPPASTSIRCCGIWIAAARKSTTGTT